MDPDEAILEVEEAMIKCVDYLNHEFVGVRTGKASPALIENIDVNVQAYGGVSKLKSLAIISSPDSRMLLVQPFDPATNLSDRKHVKDALRTRDFSVGEYIVGRVSNTVSINYT